MEKDEFIKEVEKLISLSETETALNLMQDFLSCRDTKMHKECLILSGRFYKIKRDSLMFDAPEDEYSSKIIPAMLNMISRIKYKNFEMRPVSIPDYQHPFSEFREWFNRKFKVVFEKSKQDVTSELLLEHQLASKWQRFTAHLLEMILLGVIAISLVYMVDGDVDALFRDSNKSIFNSFENFYGSLLAGILGAILYPRFSGNIGHRLMGIKLIEIKTGAECRSSWKGFKREFVKSLFYILIIPNLWILFDHRNQNYYDRIFGIVAVRKEKEMEFRQVW